MRVSRVKKEHQDLRSRNASEGEIQKTTVDLAVAEVERYNFTTSFGIEPSIQLSAIDFELAARQC